MDERMREYLENRKRSRLPIGEALIASAAGIVIAGVCLLPWIVFGLPWWAGILAGVPISFALRPAFSRFAEWRGWEKRDPNG